MILGTGYLLSHRLMIAIFFPKYISVYLHYLLHIQCVYILLTLCPLVRMKSLDWIYVWCWKSTICLLNYRFLFRTSFHAFRFKRMEILCKTYVLCSDMPIIFEWNKEKRIQAAIFGHNISLHVVLIHFGIKKKKSVKTISSKIEYSKK